MSTPPAALQPVLNTLSGKTMTLGWDVIVGYDLDAVNDLFAQQYVANVRANQNLGPLNTQVDFTSTARVTLENVWLGPPLITFAPNTQQVNVQLNFIAGGVLVESQAGASWFPTGYQSIVPGDQYSVTMSVNLQKAPAKLTAGQAATVDLQSGTNYSANLVPGTSAALFLGKYFQEFFQKAEPGSLTYELGSLVFGTSETLTPTSFDIRTQPCETAWPSSPGRLVPWIPTTPPPGQSVSLE